MSALAANGNWEKQYKFPFLNHYSNNSIIFLQGFKNLFEKHYVVQTVYIKCLLTPKKIAHTWSLICLTFSISNSFEVLL